MRTYTLTIEPNICNRGYLSVDLFDGNQSQHKVIGSDQSDLAELLDWWRLDKADLASIYARILAHFLMSDAPISFTVREAAIPLSGARYLSENGRAVVLECMIRSPWRFGWFQFRFEGARRSNLLPQAEFRARFQPMNWNSVEA